LRRCTITASRNMEGKILMMKEGLSPLLAGRRSRARHPTASRRAPVNGID
jgi:hypothetical protein